MDITLHWDVSKINFINQEIGKSAKHRMGTKPNKLQLTTTISIARERIDLKFKKILEAKLRKAKPALRGDLSVKIFADRLYILSARDVKKLSNEIANVIVLNRGCKDIQSLDKKITERATVLK